MEIYEILTNYKFEGDDDFGANTKLFNDYSKGMEYFLWLVNKYMCYSYMKGSEYEQGENWFVAKNRKFDTIIKIFFNKKTIN